MSLFLRILKSCPRQPTSNRPITLICRQKRPLLRSRTQNGRTGSANRFDNEQETGLQSISPIRPCVTLH